jgi:Ca2+-binding RTX toxin-like protein
MRAGNGFSRLVGATVATACAAAILIAPAAFAQEAPICLKVQEKLDDGFNDWHGSNGKDSVTGLRGRDHMDGRGGSDRINGGRDNDLVKGGDGDDLLCGGRGGDKIYGGPGDDIIFGEEENDKIYPGPGDDQVLGSAGNDRIYGWGKQGGNIVDDGIDILDGGFNDDVIEAGGADTLLGFTHNDILSTKTPLIAPALMDGGGNDDQLFGSEADDNMHGGENGRDTLFGAGGNDKLYGEGNDDELYGQLGDDDLFGGDGFDFLNGGLGVDSCDGGELRDDAAECESETAVERHAR